MANISSCRNSLFVQSFLLGSDGALFFDQFSNLPIFFSRTIVHNADITVCSSHKMFYEILYSNY